MVHAVRIETAGAALDSVDFVAFGEEEFGEIGAILAGDAGDKGSPATVWKGGSHLFARSHGA